MLTDNRLDFIKDINQQYIDMMTDLRKDFIALDARLRILGGMETFKNEGAARCIAIARTNIEDGLQYAIKALCIMGENKK